MVVSLYRPQERFESALGRRFILLLLFGILLALALLFWPTPVQGQTLLPDADQPCADCHETENAAWQASPHAISRDPTTGVGGATCTACHGAYVKDHPRAGVMTLAVDSTVCADCHRETFAQWQGTVHAEADVECTSCHLSHSQTLRLTDEALCVSCHKDPIGDRFHLAHWVSQVPCTGCHLTPPANTAVADGAPALALPVSLAASAVAPSHDFVLVSAQKCLDCHRTDVTNVSWLTNDDKARAQLLDKTQQAATLSTQLDTAESQVRTLGVLTPVVLGVGISFGGFVGIVFMLWLSRWGSKKEEP